MKVRRGKRLVVSFKIPVGVSVIPSYTVNSSICLVNLFIGLLHFVFILVTKDLQLMLGMMERFGTKGPNV